MVLFWREFLAELVGTFLYAFSTLFVGNLSPLSEGVTYVAIAQAIDHITRAHINPAISLGIWVSGRITGVVFLTYFMAQLIGGMGGAGLAKILRQDDETFCPRPENQSSIVRYLAQDVLTVFILVISALGATDLHRSPNIGIHTFAIGCGVAASSYVGSHKSPAAINLASRIGKDLMCLYVTEEWVQLVGTGLGSLLAAVMYTWIFSIKAIRAAIPPPPPPPPPPKFRRMIPSTP